MAGGAGSPPGLEGPGGWVWRVGGLHSAMGQNEWDPILVGRCTTHFRLYFSGDWDVHGGNDLTFDPWPYHRCPTRGVPVVLVQEMRGSEANKARDASRVEHVMREGSNSNRVWH